MPGPNILSAFGIMKVMRVMRIGKLITKLPVKMEIKQTLNLCNLIFILTIFVHLVGCIYYWLVMEEKQWVPPLDYIYGGYTDFHESGKVE